MRPSRKELEEARDRLLLALGLGLTNVVARASARADEVTAEKLLAGGADLRRKMEEHRPAWLAVLGVTAYRSAFGHRRAQVGPQEAAVGDTKVWVLPNPSGLNAHWTPATIAAEMARLRLAAETG